MLELQGHSVTHVDVHGSVWRQGSLEEKVNRLSGHDVVLLWNWDLHINPGDVSTLRQALPESQKWVLFNWDDPMAWGQNSHRERRDMIESTAPHLDLVYTTGSSTVEKYKGAGSKHVRHTMVPYSDLFHHYDPDPEYACDINFIATNYYDDFTGLLSSRRAIVEALADAPDIDAVIYYLDPGNANNTDAFKTSGIRFEDNRKVFSSCKLTLNLLGAAEEECNDGHWYSNERFTTAMASGGVQLLEDHPCHQGVIEDKKTGVILRSHEPEQVVAQVREIINNWSQYEPIRTNAIVKAQEWHISGFIQSFLADLNSPELSVGDESTQFSSAPRL